MEKISDQFKQIATTEAPSRPGSRGNPVSDQHNQTAVRRVLAKFGRSPFKNADRAADELQWVVTAVGITAAVDL